MALWPAEYESLREEERAAARAAYDFYAPAVSDPPRTLADRVAKQRANMPASVPSPAAIAEVLAGVPCRVFRPQGDSRATYLDIHGGAMILGDAMMGDVINDQFTKRHSLTVISIDYRLAPEHPFPAGADDCVAVARWALENSPGRLLIGGGSAGGYLAAVTILRVRDELGAADRFAGCLFNAGYFDCSGTPSALGSRVSDIPDVLDPSLMPFIASCYLPDVAPDKLRDPRISPLYAPLHGLPPALFSVGSADHLLDDSLFMAARWQAFGNDAELAVYPDATHGSMSMGTSLAVQAMKRRGAFIERLLG